MFTSQLEQPSAKTSKPNDRIPPRQHPERISRNSRRNQSKNRHSWKTQRGFPRNADPRLKTHGHKRLAPVSLPFAIRFRMGLMLYSCDFISGNVAVLSLYGTDGRFGIDVEHVKRLTAISPPVAATLE